MPISTGSRRGARRATLLVAVGLAVLLAPPLRAQEAPDPTEACDDHVLASGLCLGAEALADSFVNLDGGLRRGAAALGQVKLTLLADLDRMAGLRGWSIGLGAYALVGRRPTETLTGGLAPASGAEALPTAALADAWVQYAVPGWASLRVGQMAADNEFARADAAEYLVNSTFSWPVALTEALPSGGPAYPFAAPGLRLSLADPDQGSGLRLALFSGDPGGRYGEETEPQRHNRYGINPSFTGGALMLAEAVVGADRPGEAPAPGCCGWAAGTTMAASTMCGATARGVPSPIRAPARRAATGRTMAAMPSARSPSARSRSSRAASTRRPAATR